MTNNENEFEKLAEQMALEMAASTVVTLFKELKRQGISTTDAAAIVAAILKAQLDEGVEDANRKSNGESEHEA